MGRQTDNAGGVKSLVCLIKGHEPCRLNEPPLKKYQLASDWPNATDIGCRVHKIKRKLVRWDSMIYGALPHCKWCGSFIMKRWILFSTRNQRRVDWELFTKHTCTETKHYNEIWPLEDPYIEGDGRYPQVYANCAAVFRNGYSKNCALHGLRFNHCPFCLKPIEKKPELSRWEDLRTSTSQLVNSIVQRTHRGVRVLRHWSTSSLPQTTGAILSKALTKVSGYLRQKKLTRTK